MEEKERYELFGEFGIIHDTSPNAELMLLNKFQTCEILNKQDKENQQLKQQLHDLPKNIVGEIEEQLFNYFKVKNIEEYNKLPLIDSLFTADTMVEILQTILEMFGGENESKS